MSETQMMEKEELEKGKLLANKVCVGVAEEDLVHISQEFSIRDFKLKHPLFPRLMHRLWGIKELH